MSVFHNPSKQIIKCVRCGEKEEIFTSHRKTTSIGKNKRKYCTACIHFKKLEYNRLAGKNGVSKKKSNSK